MECSFAWQGLSAWGSAVHATFWVALEQPGPWGRDALVESRLDAELGARWGGAASDAGGRLLLMRAPGHHVAEEDFAHRRVLVAGGLSGSAWLLEGTAESEDQFDALPWEQIALGDRDAVLAACPWLAPAEGPVLLVCTNAKRDRCCALRGRPIVQELAEAGLAVWECSHTGGHRFAPTGVVLPLGQVVGRLTAELGRAVLDAAASGRFAVGTLSEVHDRGSSHLPPREQAAVSWVRAHEGETDPAALVVVGSDGTVTVQHADGRTWELVVDKVLGEDLPESCGKPGKPAATWGVRLA